MTETIVNTPVERIEEQLAAAGEAVAGRDIKRVVFAACGGSYAVLMPGEYYVSTVATTLDSVVFNAAEFTSRASNRVDENTLVVTCSHSGNTPETVSATEHARSRGALTIAFTHELGSPLAEAAEYVIGYQHGPEKRENYVAPHLLLRFLARVLDAVEGSSRTSAIDDAVAKMETIIPAAKSAHAERANQWGFEYRREPLIYTMAAGTNYGAAYSFAVCLLQEMQWIHSACIHSGEYFHGPFEITDTDIPFIALLGMDETRPVEQRAVDFLEKYSRRALVVDAKEFGLEVLDPSVQGVAAHLVFNSVLRIYADAIADHRGHPLSVRRYMWRMEY